MGLINYAKTSINYRDKLIAKLKDTLEIGKKYLVSFKVTSVESWRYSAMNGACNNIGILFSTHFYSLSNVAPTNNFCQLKADSIIKDTVGWELISGSFIADSSYTFITLGNFYKDSNTNAIKYYPYPSNPLGLTCFTFIDDIFVGYDSTQDHKGINEITESNFSAYPNPATDKITIDFNHQQFKSLVITDLLGRQIYFDNQLNASKKEIDVSYLQNGFYIIELTTNSNYKRTKKINIFHN